MNQRGSVAGAARGGYQCAIRYRRGSMRPRDRLAELRRLAESSGVRLESDPATPPAPSPAVDDLFLEVERIRDWIHELNGNTQLLRRLHADPTFHTNKHLQEQLEAASASSAALGTRVCAALRRLEAAAAGGGRGAAARIARLQYAAARTHLADALFAHHAALAALRDERRLLLRHQIQLTNLTISDEECEALLESKNLSLFVDNVRAETAEARRALRDAEARRDELARVEAALREVRDLFAQLAVLVAAQQQQVDSVEYYALQASEHVESGGQELLKGTITRTKTRKKKLSLIICVTAGVLVVLLVLVCT